MTFLHILLTAIVYLIQTILLQIIRKNFIKPCILSNNVTAII